MYWRLLQFINTNFSACLNALQYFFVDLPCRIRIRLDGLEWFIYNRTPAYEYLQSVLERLNRDPNQPQNASDRPENVTGEHGHGMHSFSRALVKPSFAPVTVSDELPSSAQKDMMFRWILPIEMSVSTGAITVGLPDLPSILIIYYKDAVGAYETVQVIVVGTSVISSSRYNQRYFRPGRYMTIIERT